MAEGERDDTQDWVLPAGSRPPTIGQIEQRVDHALAVARASEAAALEIGAAAIDAAEQARRAAEAAERASEAAARPASAQVETRDQAPSGPEGNGSHPAASEPEPPAFDSLRDFAERAERLSARLAAMAPVP